MLCCDQEDSDDDSDGDSDDDSEKPQPWSPEEDEELRAAVEQQGAASWPQKAEAFSTERSDSALAHRWARLASEWSAEELANLEKLVKKDGAGGWGAKAERLGTGRTAKALESKWKAIVAAERKAKKRSKDEEELQAWLLSVEAGDSVSAIEHDGQWYPAKVLESERRRLYIHFQGTMPRYRCHLGCILLKMATTSLPSGLHSSQDGHNIAAIWVAFFSRSQRYRC